MGNKSKKDIGFNEKKMKMYKVSNFYFKILTGLAFLIFPVIYFLIYLRRTKGTPKRILVIPQLTRVGDLICSTPVFRAIKEKYPDSFLAVMVSKKISGILKNNPRIDKLIIFEDYKYKFLSLIRTIKNDRYDWGISTSGTPLSSVLFFYGLIPNRSMLIREDRTISDMLVNWMSNFWERYKERAYLPGFYLKMLNNLGVYNARDIKEVFTGKDSERKVADFLENAGVLAGDRLVGMSISTGNKVKEWGDEKFLTVARELSRKYRAKIIFVGSSAEKERISGLIKKEDTKIFIDATGFSLEDAPALFKRFSLFVAADTGPIYIAKALNIPLVDIVGPVDPNEQIPNDEISIQIRPKEGIEPSVFAFRPEGSAENHRRALDSTSVEEVLRAADKLLG